MPSIRTSSRSVVSASRSEGTAEHSSLISESIIHKKIREQQSYHRQYSLNRHDQSGIRLNGEEFAIRQIQVCAETARRLTNSA